MKLDRANLVQPGTTWRDRAGENGCRAFEWCVFQPSFCNKHDFGDTHLCNSRFQEDEIENTKELGSKMSFCESPPLCFPKVLLTIVLQFLDEAATQDYGIANSCYVRRLAPMISIMKVRATVLARSGKKIKITQVMGNPSKEDAKVFKDFMRASAI
jgi:hypothetical protein